MKIAPPSGNSPDKQMKMAPGKRQNIRGAGVVWTLNFLIVPEKDVFALHSMQKGRKKSLSW